MRATDYSLLLDLRVLIHLENLHLDKYSHLLMAGWLWLWLFIYVDGCWWLLIHDNGRVSWIIAATGFKKWIMIFILLVNNAWLKICTTTPFTYFTGSLFLGLRIIRMCNLQLQLMIRKNLGHLLMKKNYQLTLALGRAKNRFRSKYFKLCG